MSSADRVGRTGHGQLIASPLTLALLGGPPGGGELGVPLHRRFTLGMLRLELLASGRGLGAAALHVEHDGGRVLYAGTVRTEVPGATIELGMEPAGVKPCDAVVVAAPYGEERHRFPPLADAIAQTIGWVRAQLALERRPVLLVDSALDGLELAVCLAAEGLAVAGSRPIREVARRAGAFASQGVGVSSARALRDFELRAGEPADDASAPAPRPSSWAIAAPGRELRATLWLASDRQGLSRALGDNPPAVARVSGHVLDSAVPGEAGFAWSSAAGRAPLLSWIEATSAREVFVTGAGAESIVAALGARAHVIGPPHQMTLFPREAAP